jgi:hypothetical protein
VGIVGDVRIQTVQSNGRAIRQTVCMGGREEESLPPLMKPQQTGISPLAVGLERYEKAETSLLVKVEYAEA